MTSAKEEIQCVWEINDQHDGETRSRLIFEGQLNVPICDKHFEEHMNIMTMARNDHDVEKLLDMDEEERKRYVLTLKLSGMDISDTKP